MLADGWIEELMEELMGWVVWKRNGGGRPRDGIIYPEMRVHGGWRVEVVLRCCFYIVCCCLRRGCMKEAGVGLEDVDLARPDGVLTPISGN